MESQPDFFGTGNTPNELATYPDCAGYKGSAETGREAAEAMQPHLGRLQRIVYEAIKARGLQGLTPEEACDVLGLGRVSIQPRFSELREKGLIADCGRRRRNPSSGKNAVVWVIAEMAPDGEGRR